MIHPIFFHHFWEPFFFFLGTNSKKILSETRTNSVGIVRLNRSLQGWLGSFGTSSGGADLGGNSKHQFKKTQSQSSLHLKTIERSTPKTTGSNLGHELLGLSMLSKVKESEGQDSEALKLTKQAQAKAGHRSIVEAPMAVPQLAACIT